MRTNCFPGIYRMILRTPSHKIPRRTEPCGLYQLVHANRLFDANQLEKSLLDLRKVPSNRDARSCGVVACAGKSSLRISVGNCFTTVFPARHQLRALFDELVRCRAYRFGNISANAVSFAAKLRRPPRRHRRTRDWAPHYNHSRCTRPPGCVPSSDRQLYNTIRQTQEKQGLSATACCLIWAGLFCLHRQSLPIRCTGGSYLFNDSLSDCPHSHRMSTRLSSPPRHRHRSLSTRCSFGIEVRPPGRS